MDLVDGDELVGLMGLLDGAGAADHDRAAGVLELTGLGAVTDEMYAIVAGNRPDKGFRL